MAKKNNLARLKRNYLILKALKNTGPTGKKLIIKKSNSDFIKCLCDVCYNILRGNCNLSKKHKRKLIFHKKIIRKLADKNNTIESKRKSLSQKGGFLGSLVVPAISIAASLLGNLLHK